MVIDSVSESSVSLRPAVMSSGMDVAPAWALGAPSALASRSRLAASAMPLTSTSMKPRPVCAPSASISEIVSEKSTSESAAGVTVRPATSSGLRVQVSVAAS